HTAGSPHTPPARAAKNRGPWHLCAAIGDGLLTGTGHERNGTPDPSPGLRPTLPLRPLVSHPGALTKPFGSRVPGARFDTAAWGSDLAERSPYLRRTTTRAIPPTAPLPLFN